ncbi:MAG TPA: DPP IV N-terminal domain-containing protein [Candidatus Baltobacteraceae bacterium]|nr:DPP IV N-terminal domain-containing protein [Candidatus Baltobacteraceae bacterium]
MLTAVLLSTLSFSGLFAPVAPWGAMPDRIAWSPDGSKFAYVRSMQDAKRAQPVRLYDLRTGRETILVDPQRYAGRARTPSSVVWSPDGRRLAFMLHGTVYVRDLRSGAERAVAQNAGDFQWSPHSDAIAYTKDANLYLAVLTPSLRIRKLTGGGVENDILNGELDWVYPEELGTAHGFEWSPDGRRIAYLRMDERKVTAFPIVDFLAPDNAVDSQRYPLAGEHNPRVSLREIDLSAGSDRLVYDGGPRDEYLAAFGYEGSVPTLLAEVMDRAQQHVRVVEWRADGTEHPLYLQSSNTWVDVIPLPQWLPGGRSLWILDRDNVQSLYLRSASGSLRAIGPRVHTFRVLGVKHAEVYTAAAYPTRRDQSVLAIALNGSRFVDLTPKRGTHAVSFSPQANAFVDTYSSLNDPPSATVQRVASGAAVRLVPQNTAFKRELLRVEMLQVRTQIGNLDAYMIRPPNFDPSRKYPVVMYAYGGPQAPTTSDRWFNAYSVYHQMLARAGFIVFSIDGPASQYGNSAGVRRLYHNFGPASLAGQIAGARYLQSLAFVDSKRIGIWGWSFGGYESLYAMTHDSPFKAAIACSPVSDWHLYDSIYTERYMGKPGNDARGYDRSSDIAGSARVHGPLLVNHGTGDDNVHVANTISFLQFAAQTDATRVDFFTYPRQLHHYASLADLRHLYEHMFAWWQAHL